jgi:hypothetical protein
LNVGKSPRLRAGPTTRTNLVNPFISLHAPPAFNKLGPLFK